MGASSWELGWIGGLVDWWIGGLVGWWIGGLVDWGICGLVNWWIGDFGKRCVKFL